MPRFAYLCPDRIHQDRRNDRRFRAEVKFYDLLDQQLPAGWRVFYDVGWLNRLRPEKPLRDGQTDFIVGHPYHGILVIEVKGGGITFDGPRQQWVSTDADGIDHDIKNPFRQTQDSKYTLIEKLRELPTLKNVFVELHHAVAFPDRDRPEKPITTEARPEIIIGRQDLGKLTNRLVEILKHSRGQQEFANGKEILDGLEFLLCRKVTLPNPLQSQIDDEHREMQTLTNSQINVLALLQRVRRVALGGGAGSGKTYVAVKKARELAKQGFETLLTCYTEPLAEFLKSVVVGTPNLKVASVKELAREWNPHIAPNPPNPDATYSAGLFDAATQPGRKLFDAILVDEGQDLTGEWWTALEACLREGKEDGIIYVFHDTNNQVVFPGRGVLPKNLVPIPLEENVRNTQNVCRMLTPHYRGDVAIRPRGPAGQAVEVHSYADEAGLATRLGKVLHRLLLVENLLARDIVVLTPRTIGVDSALPKLGLPNGINLVTSPSVVKGRAVLCANIAEFKGLERPVVVVAELDHTLAVRSEVERNALLYVAFSRPRNLLVVLHSPAAAEWILPG